LRFSSPEAGCGPDLALLLSSPVLSSLLSSLSLSHDPHEKEIRASIHPQQ